MKKNLPEEGKKISQGQLVPGPYNWTDENVLFNQRAFRQWPGIIIGNQRNSLTSSRFKNPSKNPGASAGGVYGEGLRGQQFASEERIFFHKLWFL
jgi:hypothetical protein